MPTSYIRILWAATFFKVAIHSSRTSTPHEIGTWFERLVIFYFNSIATVRLQPRSKFGVLATVQLLQFSLFLHSKYLQENNSAVEQNEGSFANVKRGPHKGGGCDKVFARRLHEAISCCFHVIKCTDLNTKLFEM